MGFEEVLDKRGNLVENELGRFLAEELERGHRYHPMIGALYDSLDEYCARGGKRLAACSTMMTYEGYSGRLDDRILRVACGVELFRHSILVHDDLVDRDEMRRGGETIHRMLVFNMDRRFGEGAAIFTGDIVFSMALRAIIRSGFDPEDVMEVMDLITGKYQEVNESQVLDLAFEYIRPDWGEWEIMASRRAASLFRATMLTGAMLGNAPGEDLDALARAGEHIGFAFDIQDDIIDTFASRDQYGRDPCGDISKGKKPLHIVLAMERDQEFGGLVEGIVSGERKLDPDEVRDRIESSGALDEAKAVSRSHARSAREEIDSTSMGADSKEFFLSLIDFVDESLDWYRGG